MVSDDRLTLEGKLIQSLIVLPSFTSYNLISAEKPSETGNRQQLETTAFMYYALGQGIWHQKLKKSHSMIRSKEFDTFKCAI